MACVVLGPTSAEPVPISAELLTGAKLTGELATDKFLWHFQGSLLPFLFMPYTLRDSANVHDLRSIVELDALDI